MSSVKAEVDTLRQQLLNLQEYYEQQSLLLRQAHQQQLRLVEQANIDRRIQLTREYEMASLVRRQSYRRQLSELRDQLREAQRQQNTQNQLQQTWAKVKSVGMTLFPAAAGAMSIGGLMSRGFSGTVEWEKLNWELTRLGRQLASTFKPVIDIVTHLVGKLADWMAGLDKSGQNLMMLAAAAIAAAIALGGTRILRSGLSFVARGVAAGGALAGGAAAGSALAGGAAAGVTLAGGAAAGSALAEGAAAGSALARGTATGAALAGSAATGSALAEGAAAGAALAGSAAAGSALARGTTIAGQAAGGLAQAAQEAQKAKAASRWTSALKGLKWVGRIGGKVLWPLTILGAAIEGADIYSSLREKGYSRFGAALEAAARGTLSTLTFGLSERWFSDDKSTSHSQPSENKQEEENEQKGRRRDVAISGGGTQELGAGFESIHQAISKVMAPSEKLLAEIRDLLRSSSRPELRRTESM